MTNPIPPRVNPPKLSSGAKPKRPLPENEFIQEGFKKDPAPFWFWLFIVGIISVLAWGIGSWGVQVLTREVKGFPFLQVTNRELSLFLWQHPQYMRSNASTKTGYLPGFLYVEKVTIDVPYADEFIQAPPELLFQYHTWDRLVSKEFAPRPIPLSEFREFLSYVSEWQPQFWPAAPTEYVDFIANLAKTQEEDLAKLPLTTVPLEVRQAFQGWKNYFKEGEQINSVKPTFGEMNEFLEHFPHYARNYWRNLVMDLTPQYLYTSTFVPFATFDTNADIPSEELNPFLKLAFFNYQQSLKNK
jgi:hypothetical protein